LANRIPLDPNYRRIQDLQRLLWDPTVASVPNVGLLGAVPTAPRSILDKPFPAPAVSAPLPVAPAMRGPVALPSVGTPPPNASGGGILDALGNGIGEVFGGPNDPNLSPEENRHARALALIRAGLATIANSGNGGGALRALAGGALAGQEVGAASRATSQATAQRAKLAAIVQSGAGLPQLMQVFQEMIAAGDVEGAKAVGTVIQSVQAAESKGKASPRIVTDPTTGQPLVVDPNTRQAGPVIGPDGQPVSFGPPPLVIEGTKFPNTTEGMTNALRFKHALALSGRVPGSEAPGAGMAEQRVFQREGQLTDDYRSETKDVQSAYNFIDGALKQAPLAKAGDPTAQVGLLYAFVKAMDPNSVVREGEISLVNGAAPIYQRAQRLVQEYALGKSPAIPPAMVGQMVQYMTKMQAEKESYWSDIYDNYTSRAKRWGVDASAFRAPPSRYRSKSAPVELPILSKYGAKP
jgi:hypothetical protein